MDDTCHETTEPNPLVSKSSLSNDHSSVTEEELWHDNDLLLAAKLGKALLDRNHVLENALEQARMAEEEKTAEVEFLLKQLTELRELSQRKAVFVDEADSYNMELDRNNRRLMKQLMADKQKISRLSSNVIHLEQQLNDLLDELARCGRHDVDSRMCCKPSSRYFTRRRSISPTRRYPAPHTASRPRPGLLRGQFIDDELVDQPQLSFVAPSIIPPASLSSQTSLVWPMSRVTSCPVLVPDAKLLTKLKTGTGADVDMEQKLPNLDRSGIVRCPQCGFSLVKDVKKNTSYGHLEPKTAATVHESIATESTEMSPVTWTKSDRGTDLRDLQDLLDDAAFIRRLENIYSLKSQCGVPSMSSTDYQPEYKQLFQDAFRMLRDLRQGQTQRRTVRPMEEEF